MNKKSFKWKPSPQPSLEEFAKMMRESPNKKVSKEFRKILYQIWDDQSEAQV